MCWLSSNFKEICFPQINFLLYTGLKVLTAIEKWFTLYKVYYFEKDCDSVATSNKREKINS